MQTANRAALRWADGISARGLSSLATNDLTPTTSVTLTSRRPLGGTFYLYRRQHVQPSHLGQKDPRYGPHDDLSARRSWQSCPQTDPAGRHHAYARRFACASSTTMPQATGRRLRRLYDVVSERQRRIRRTEDRTLVFSYRVKLPPIWCRSTRRPRCPRHSDRNWRRNVHPPVHLLHSRSPNPQDDPLGQISQFNTTHVSARRGV